MISPLSASTVDWIERFVNVGPGELADVVFVPGTTAESSVYSCSFRMPPSVICGFTCSVRPTSRRSYVLNALAVVPLVRFEYEPVGIGTFWPTTIFASSLSSVTRFGVDSTFASLEPAKNCSKAPKPCTPNMLCNQPMFRPFVIEPSDPSVPPGLVTAPAVRLTMLLPRPVCPVTRLVPA